MRPAGELLLLVAACLIQGTPGPLDASARTMLIALSIAGWCVSAIGQARRDGSRGFMPFLAAAGPPLLAVAAIGRLADPLDRLACLAAGVTLARTPARGQACRFTGSLLGMRLFLDLFPLAWGTEVELSRLMSRAAGWVTGLSMDAGPSASGLDLLIASLLLIGSRRHAEDPRRLRRALWCAGVWLGFAAAAPALAAWRPALLFGAGGLLNQAREHLEAASTDIAPALFGLSWILLAALAAASVAWRKTSPAVGPSAPRQRLAAAAPAAVAVIGALVLGALLAVAWWPGAPRAHGRVALVKSRFVDFDVPRRDRPGIAASGMLGLLGRYLAAEGHELSIVERPLTARSLRHAVSVVVPLPEAPFTAAEKETLDRFVRRGGSLLVLADHTDLLGTMEPVNDLAAPYGVRARFDSAYPARRGWRGCLRAHRPLPAGLETGIGTGASLEIHGRARPLVVGRYALGDAGDRGNGGAGAFLGDYAWQPGEMIGDLVLASETRAGRGRVVVMGDTSSLQNVALPWCAPFVAALFDHLARRPGPWSATAWAAAGLAGLALPWFLARARRPAAWTGAAAAGLLAGGITAALASTPAPAPGPEVRAAAGPPAIVVDGRLNGWTRDLWSDASLGGLMANLQRDGFLPVVRQGVPPGLPDRDALIVLVAPRVALSPDEAVRLSEHVEHGGRVLVAAGADESAAVAPLLSLYGLTVRGLPLGPVPVRPDMTRPEYEAARATPQFRSAWPVESAGLVPVRAFHRAFDHDVVLRARGRSGHGALIVVGDPEFLTDRVLENERAAWPGNVDLLARLLEEDP